MSSHVPDVALDLFASAGYGPTTMREVAEAAAVTPASIYHRFKTKSGLLSAAVAPLVEDLETVILAPPEPRLPTVEDRILLIRGYLLSLLRHREAGQLLLYDPSTRPTPAHAELTDQHRRLVSLLLGPRASMQQQVRARCALAIAQLGVGELKSVPPHRLRRPLVEAAIDALIGSAALAERDAVGEEELIDLRDDAQMDDPGGYGANDPLYGADR
jgi:AcrR family transcriptional regulator